MADTYYETATGFGVVDDPANVPAGATIITEGDYTTQLAQWNADQEAAADADTAAAEARFVSAFQALRAVGMTVAQAELLASGVGQEPAGFNGAAEPFTSIHVTQQTAAVAFSHTINAAATVFEEISELPDLIIAEDGDYLVEWDVHGQATNTAAAAGVQVNTTAIAALYKNDVKVANSETMLALNSQGQAVTAEPALQIRASGSGSAVVTCAAGDILEIWGARSSTAGTTTTIESSSTLGRTRITATRIRL